LASRAKVRRRAGTVYDATRSHIMERFSYKFTDLLDFNSPSMEMWLAPFELFEFASIVAREMLAANPDLVDKGICVAIYNSGGTPVSMVPVGTVH
jgi:hypothetical protein